MEMQKLLMAIILSSALVLIGIFAIFSCFRYLDSNDKPERILFMVMGIFCFIVSVMTFIGIMNS